MGRPGRSGLRADDEPSQTAARVAGRRTCPSRASNCESSAPPATAPSRPCSRPPTSARWRPSLMRYRDSRNSICVSSQSGCPLTCTFCATGQMKFARNLTASEIVEQALHFRRMTAVDHCVFMGMGEPMLNLENVLAACERLPDIGITHRRTAISTVGWIPGHRSAHRTGHALAPGPLLARGRRSVAQRIDAGQRALSVRGRHRRLPSLLRAQA